MSISIPDIGFGLGTARYKGSSHNTDDSEIDVSLVETAILALESGFRHLDLAEMYGNDREAAIAIKKFTEKHPSIKREELWITSKLMESMKYPLIGCQDILDRLDIQYIDLLLLHCPLEFLKAKDSSCSAIKIDQIWKDMEELVKLGKVRYIGISNFRISDIEELLKTANIKPYMNQVEFNPYLQQSELQIFCHEHGIRMAAYSPLGPVSLWPGGPLDEILSSLSEKYNISVSSLLLKYTIQRGYTAITTTSKKERMDEYTQMISSSTPPLSKEDLDSIDMVGNTFIRRKFWASDFKTDL